MSRSAESLAVNRLLASLPKAELTRLSPRLEWVPLPAATTLDPPDEPIRNVYFVTSGVVSLTTRLADGRIFEVATVGPEGMVGISVFLECGSLCFGSCVQIPGEAWMMPADDFREVLRQEGQLAWVLRRYTQALFVQSAQCVACNAAHSIESRCARWLLQTHDRVPSDDFELKQQFLAQMLGVRRPSVTLAAGALQRRGLIHYHRGQVSVLDRTGLEQAACECYHIIRAEYDRLI